MKKYLLLFAIPFTLYGQQSSYPENEVFCQPVLISQEIGNPSGTGFFIKDSLHWYLVTAKHVIQDQKSQKLLANKIALLIFSSNLAKDTKNSMSVDLKLAMESGKLFFNLKDDAVAIEMGNVQSTANLKTYSYNSYVHMADKNLQGIVAPINGSKESFKNSHLGDEVYLFGFPTSLGLKPLPQFDYEKPLLRWGTVAGKYEERHSLMIDCFVLPGNSGGPVISRNRNKDVKDQFSLTGLVTEFVPYYDPAAEGNDKKSEETIYRANSGYAVVVPIDVVLELIQNNK